MLAETSHERAERLEAEMLAKDEQIAALTRELEGLTAKAEHAAVIEQAKGVLMHTLRCDPDAAFAALVEESQKRNVKLWRVASDLVAEQGREKPSS
jgi:AmiR/NasT family two-component response regulator